jgi:excisionase family DNA binding protein
MALATNDEQLHDLDWLAQYLQVPRRTIYRWRQYKEGPPAYPVGRHLRWRRSDVDKWLEERRTAAEAAN